MNVENRLSRLARLASADKSKRFDRLYRELTKTDLLMYAYEQIKNNKGSKTPGIDGLNKFNWNEEEAVKLAVQLQSGEYEPVPVRRVLIDKKNKPGQKRPLGIPTFRDRIVQCALKLLLEALYEPIFFDCSHGFRPHRACQTAAMQIMDSPRVRIDWVIEGDIKGCFDNICHLQYQDFWSCGQWLFLFVRNGSNGRHADADAWDSMADPHPVTRHLFCQTIGNRIRLDPKKLDLDDRIIAFIQYGILSFERRSFSKFHAKKKCADNFWRNGHYLLKKWMYCSEIIKDSCVVLW